MKNRSRILLFVLISQLTMATAAVAQTAAPEGFDAYVARVLKEFDVPGVAVAIVKDGRVVMAKGYGVRKLGEAAAVDAGTLFGIASNSKAFTAAALAMLVDEGKISWDDPVVKHLPAFQMYDPYVSREMTIRDLLTHRSGLGLGAGDLLWWPQTNHSRDEIVRRIRFIKPATSFRSRYAYDNVLYLVAGQIIPAVTGKSWDDFIKERIFTPLGMTASNTSVSANPAGGNVATPHTKNAGSLQAIEPARLDNVAPAGSINSNVSDMAKWVIAQLDNGSIRGAESNGGRLFSERQSREMWSAQTILPLNDPPPMLAPLKANFAAYGLGWGLADYRGKKIVSHTGGLPGYLSRVALVPDLKLGVVVLTNMESGGAFQSITYRVIDHYLGAAETDWIAAYRKLEDQQRAAASAVENRQSAARDSNSKPSLAVAKYAGRYTDAWYGDATISLENDRLVLWFAHTPALVADLEHWQYDTFVARWRDRTLLADAFVTFALKPDGRIEQVKMQAISPLTDFSFDFQDLLFTPAR
jgi:CubicO group peptidase (beta-lactamase class C family)